MARRQIRRFVNGHRMVLDTAYPVSTRGRAQAQARAALLRSMDHKVYVRKEGSRFKVLVAREWR